MAKPSVKKFGCPLYAAAWASDTLLILAGGGGKKTSGIQNKIVAISAEPGASSLGEELAVYASGESELDVPYRLRVHCSGSKAVVAMAGPGGCRSLLLQSSSEDTRPSVAVDDEITTSLQNVISGASVNCICFGGESDSTLILGLEDGRVLVVDYPACSLQNTIMLKDEMKEIKDLDVSPASVGPLLAATDVKGNCFVACWSSPELLKCLDMPAALATGRNGFSCCRFAPDSDSPHAAESNTLFTVVNGSKGACLLSWQWGEGSGQTLAAALREGWDKVKMRKRRQVSNDPVTCMEVSASGQFVALGTSEGDVVVCGAKTMSCARQVRQAHLVFATGVAWSPSGDRLVSVSGDASVCLLQAPPAPSMFSNTSLQLLMALLILFFALLVERMLRSS